MSEKVKNWDYFDREQCSDDQTQKKASDETDLPEAQTIVHPDLIQKYGNSLINTVGEKEIFDLISETKFFLSESGFDRIAMEVDKIEHNLKNTKFRISVVGEFSRGKSTFINKLFGRNILPEGALPTTAILTKVTYNEKDMIVYIDENGKKINLPLSEESWENLIVDIQKPELNGSAFVGLNDGWLKNIGIEIIDTPGSNDGNKKRSMLVNDALLCGDGAIITISATCAMSHSENIFIRERLLAQKVPNMMLILTRLDEVKTAERKSVINYVKNQLSSINSNIPVMIPQSDIEIPGLEDRSGIGMDNIKSMIEFWKNDSDYNQRRNASALVALNNLLSMPSALLVEKQKMTVENSHQREKEIDQIHDQLGNLSIQWEDLRIEMMKRSKKCLDWLKQNVDEKSEQIIERLKYEAGHTGTPQKWWREDYPYRLKVELMNVANLIENNLNQIYLKDVYWFNEEMKKRFSIQINLLGGAVINKNQIIDLQPAKELEMEDLNKQRMIARVGTGALTIAGYILFAGLGPIAMISSVGVGTGSAVITEHLFKGKIEKQKTELREAIEKEVPKVIESALVTSGDRLNEVYTKAIAEARSQEDIWVASQKEMLEQRKNNINSTTIQKLEEIDSEINHLSHRISKILEEA